MYNLFHVESSKYPVYDKNRKFNMMMIYFLSNTAAGSVVYIGNNEILIKSLFPDHIFTENTEKHSGHIYLVTDKYDEVLYLNLKPDLYMCKISAYEEFIHNYLIMYPPRMKYTGTKLYAITTNKIMPKKFVNSDLEAYQKIRTNKHSNTVSNLKKYCKCHDCWIEIQIIKTYITCLYFKSTRLYAIKFMINWIKKNLPIKTCISTLSY